MPNDLPELMQMLYSFVKFLLENLSSGLVLPSFLCCKMYSAFCVEFLVFCTFNGKPLFVFQLMRNLLGTHLGHSAVYNMCRIMEDRYVAVCLSEGGEQALVVAH